MWTYAACLSLSLFLYFLITRKLKKQPVYFQKNRGSAVTFDRVLLATLVSSLPLTIISGIRYSVGTDYWNTYYTSFYRILKGIKFDSFEFGYTLLIKGIQFFTDNVFVLFFLTSLIFGMFTFVAFYELSENIPLSILLLFLFRYYFISMNTIRELIAIAIMTYALKYAFKKNPKKYFICFLTALSFHTSIILFLPVYFFDKIKINRRKFFTIIVMNAVYEILDIILTGTKYGLLLNKYRVSGIKVSMFTVVLNIVLTLVAFGSYKNKKDDRKYQIMLNIQLVAALISYMFRVIPLIERVYWLYSFPIVISFPFFLENIKSKIVKQCICIGLCCTLAVIYIGYDILYLNDHGVLPYQTIIGVEPVHFSGWVY